MSDNEIEIESIAVRLPIDSYIRLRRQARRERLCNEEIVRKAIYFYLEREEAVYRKSRYYHEAIYPPEDQR